MSEVRHRNTLYIQLSLYWNSETETWYFYISGEMYKIKRTSSTHKEHEPETNIYQ